MSTVWVVVGEHHEVPGTRISVHATEADAERAADALMAGMLRDADLDETLVARYGRDAALDNLADVVGRAHASVIVQRCEIEGVSVVPIPPVRIIVDMSGGVFQGAEATVPVDVMVVDLEDVEGWNAVVPGYEATRSHDDIWAEIEAAEVDADAVNAAFDGIVWTDGEAH